MHYGLHDIIDLLRDARSDSETIAKDQRLDLDVRLRAFYRLLQIDYARSAGCWVDGQHVKPSFLETVWTAIADGVMDGSLRARYGDAMADLLLQSERHRAMEGRDL